MSVQLIACPECAFRLPYAILGRQGSYRTGSEFAALCRHRPPAQAGEGADAMACPALRGAAEHILKVRFPERGGEANGE